jgi:hypothetical protein
MRQKVTSLFPVLIVVVILIVLPNILYAQGPEDPGGDPAPIDGGASIVIAACAGYLAKRKQNNKNKMS